jgi:hypothetical protein
MKRKAGQALAWLAATAASILLATSAVSSVRDEVTTRPSPLRVPVATIAAAAGVTTSTTAPAVTDPESTPPPVVSTTGTSAAPGSTTTTAAPSTTTAPRPPATTSTTTSTTTTTAAPDDDYFESYQLIGGWVRLRVAGDKVFLAGTVPSPGFTLEIEEDGPEQVKVEFSSNDHESSLKAEFSDGELEVETSEEDD